jgi:hypothetical protein
MIASSACFFFFAIGPLTRISLRGKIWKQLGGKLDGEWPSRLTNELSPSYWIQTLELHGCIVLRPKRADCGEPRASWTLPAPSPRPRVPPADTGPARCRPQAVINQTVDCAQRPSRNSHIRGLPLDETSDKGAFLQQEFVHDITARPWIEATHVPNEHIMS